MKKENPRLPIRWMDAWLLPFLLLVLWDVSSRLGWLPQNVFPSPESVFVAAIKLTLNGDLFTYMFASTERALTGFLIGGSLGLVLGILSGIFPLWGKFIDPTLQMLRNVPHLGYLPLIILIFGFSEQTKLIVISVGSFFPIYLNTFHGIRSLDQRYLEMGSAYNLSKLGILREITIPGAMPYILVGVRFSFTVMWITLIVAESISTDPGIGYMARYARERGYIDIVVLTVVIYAVLGKTFDSITRLLERKWLKWHPKYSKTEG